MMMVLVTVMTAAAMAAVTLAGVGSSLPRGRGSLQLKA
jgi:hypothetical protein